MSIRLRSVTELLKDWVSLQHSTPPELAVTDQTYLVELIVNLKKISAALDGEFTLVEEIAEALWQEESLRAAGMRRKIPWDEASEDTQELWRAHARVALAVVKGRLIK
jgi:hypothetical protein